MCGKGGVCIVKGKCMEKGRGHTWWRGGRGHMWWGYVLGGVYGRRCAWQGCAWQGMYMAGGHVWHKWGGGICAGQMATEAGGMHPTGMHSCSWWDNWNYIHINVNYNKFDLFAKVLVIIHEDTQERNNLTFIRWTLRKKQAEVRFNNIKLSVKIA